MRWLAWWQAMTGVLDATIFIQLAIALIPLGAAWFGYRASTRTNQQTLAANAAIAARTAELERSKADAEAFRSAKEFYVATLADQDAHLERLRARVVALEAEMASTGRLMQVWRRQLVAAGITPAQIEGGRHED